MEIFSKVCAYIFAFLALALALFIFWHSLPIWNTEAITWGLICLFISWLALQLTVKKTPFPRSVLVMILLVMGILL